MSGVWVPVLRATRVFGGVADEVLDHLARESSEVALEPEEWLFRQGDAADALYVVREGRLLVVAEEKGQQPRALSIIEAGSVVGESALIMEGGRSAGVRSATAARLLRLPTDVFQRALAEHPALRRALNELVAERLPGLIDASLRSELSSELAWIRLSREAVLFHAGDPPDAVYVVVRGRLGAFRCATDGREELVSEIGRGESVGEIALLTREPRSLTVRALRDSELVRLSAAGFETTLIRNPQAVVPLARTLAARLRSRDAPRRAPARTLALLPLSASLAVEGFARDLESGLRETGAVRGIVAAEFDAVHGTGASGASPDSEAAIRFTPWLESLEGAHDFVVYRCDPAPTPWTRLCVGRADRVLLLAPGGERPELGELARLIQERTPTTRELVLLHAPTTRLPSGTAEWLRAVRPARHHHVRSDRREDALRVARYQNGRAVGVVFSGGGARGFAHVGVLRALREQRVAIDSVGGASMGVFPAVAQAMAVPPEELVEWLRRVFVHTTGPVRPYTVPLVSIFSSRRGERALGAIFGDTRIEDLWLDCFCAAADITRGAAWPIREGLVRRAVRASASFPGLFPPVPHEGNLIVDGGLFSNLPIDLMAERCPGPIVASDVSREIEMQVDPALTAAPSPWQLLWSRFPFVRRVRFPSLSEILMRAIDAREAARRAELRRTATFCFLPPVAEFALDQLAALDEIVALGSRYAAARVLELPSSIARCGPDYSAG